MKAKTRWFVLALSLALTATARAHHVWIEPAEGGALAMRYGHFELNQREASPGYLDVFLRLQPQQIEAGRATPLVAEKWATGYYMQPSAGAGSVIVEDHSRPVFKSEHGDRAGARIWTWFGARHARGGNADAQPRLTLDVLPTGEPGWFQITFKNEPLARARVRIYVPSGWQLETRSDARGRVRFDLPWRGPYMVYASHTQDIAGERRSDDHGVERYDGLNYVTTLTFTQAEGLPALPPAPLRAPNERK